MSNLITVIPYKHYHDGHYEFLLNEKDINRSQGHWINGSYTNGTYYKKCNQCFAVIDETFFSYDFDVNFCPSCGARMKGIDNEY